MSAPITRLRDRLGVDVVLGVYVVALLVIPSRYTVGSFALTASMLVAVMAGVLWVAGLAHGGRTVIASTPAGRGLLTFLLVSVLAYTVTMLNPNVTSVVSAADRKMAATICAGAAALLALDALRSRAALERVLRVMVFAGGLVAAIAAVQYAIGYDVARLIRLPGFGGSGPVAFVFSRAGLTRVAGTMRHPIELGIMCATLLPLALHLSTFARRRRDRRLAAAVAGLLVLVLPMALSRAGVLAGVAALAVVLWFLPPSRRRRLLAAGAVLLLSFAVLVPNLTTTMRDLFTTELAEGSNAARAESAQIALDRYEESPVLGQGLGSLDGVIVDNQYVLALGETGLVGLAGVVVLWFGVVGSARRARRTTDDRAARDLGATFIAMITAVAVGSFGFATLGTSASIGIVLLVVGLAGAHQRLTAAEVEPADEAGPPAAAAAAAGRVRSGRADDPVGAGDGRG